MLLTDEATIRVLAGRGGNGVVSFNRKRNLAKGGPDGGNGGPGGNVYLKVDNSLNSLHKFRYQTTFTAEEGSPGQGQQKQGGRGNDLIIYVPPGTELSNAHTGEAITSLTLPDETLLIANGGAGGLGNFFFRSSVNRIPRFQTPGKQGEEVTLSLQLQMLADVGLVGQPNAGKSTLISVLSQAKPKIGAFPFTTLTPQLGAMQFSDGRALVVADIPGLIKGSSEGKGLGAQFLRHIQRTRLLMHLVSVEGISHDETKESNQLDETFEDWLAQLVENFLTIRHEMQEFSDELAAKPYWLLLTKSDILHGFSLLSEQTEDIIEGENLTSSLPEWFAKKIHTALESNQAQPLLPEKSFLISSVNHDAIDSIQDQLHEWLIADQKEAQGEEEVLAPHEF